MIVGSLPRPDSAVLDAVRPAASWLFRRYWRVQTHGLENIPERGPVILIGNHSGTFPLDAAMIGHAVESERGRNVRPLYHPWIDGFPVLARGVQSLGGVTATLHQASGLLAAGEAVLWFPEGVSGVAKPFAERYQIRRFATSAGRLALEQQVPIVPFGLVGAEESSPLLGRSEALGESAGLPYIPITLGAALAGPLGYLPLPTKWSLRFGRRIHLHRERRFQRAADPGRIAARLQRAVQNQVARELFRRRSLFLG